MKGIVFSELPRIPLDLDEHYDYLRRGKAVTLLHRAVFFCALVLLRVYDFLLFGLRIRGWENRLKLGPSGAVAVCNHVHTLDCTMLAQVLWPKRQYYVTLQSNLEMKGVRHLVRLLGGIPIPEDRELRRAFPAVLQDALAHGAAVPIYPEGELDYYCEHLRPFKNTAFSTAWQAGVPVIPLCITYREPRGIWRLKKRPCLTLHILPAVFPDLSAPKGREVPRMREETFRRMLACQEAHRRDPAGQ